MDFKIFKMASIDKLPAEKISKEGKEKRHQKHRSARMYCIVYIPVDNVIFYLSDLYTSALKERSFEKTKMSTTSVISSLCM